MGDIRHTSLHFAVMEKDEDLVRRLIDGGADPNGRDRWGRTALWYSIQPDSPEMQRLFDVLLEAGADPSIPDEFGDTALHNAVAFVSSDKHLKNVERLIRPALLEMRNEQDKTPLYVASESNEDGWASKVMRLLLAAGADVHTQAGDSSPLHFLACWGLSEPCGVLLKAGVAANGREGAAGMTALEYACKAGHVETVRVLLSYGADINALGQPACALVSAAEFGSAAVVRLLLEAGADVSLTYRGQTACEHAERFVAETGTRTLAKRLEDLAARWEVTGEVKIVTHQTTEQEAFVEVQRGGSSLSRVDGHARIVELLSR